MSSTKDEEILITFGELNHMQIDEIATCIDKYEALSICEKSSAHPIEIFNIWVQKLFKAYDISKFNKSDWLQILHLLEKIFNKFIQDLSALENDNPLNHLNLWWTDTLELLKCMESIINEMDVQILASILNFVLEVIIKTCTITDTRNNKPVITINQKLLHFLINYMLKKEIENVEEFNVCNKVILSLCDVAAIIFSTDIKLSIETWSATAKLTNKCNAYYKKLDQEERVNLNLLKCDCSEKPIRGILKELRKLFQHFVEDDAVLNNDNYLKVAQFYLRLLKIIMQNSDSIFSAVKEYFELYTLCMHQLKKKNERKFIDFLQKDLLGILELIYEQMDIVEYICEHLLNDNKLCESCDLILDYMQLCLEHDGRHIPSVATASRMFDIIFDGHLIFADNDKYSKVVSYYVALIGEDVTSELHMKLCNNVMGHTWIKAYVSYEILLLFYNRYIKADKEKAFACLEFWIKSWQKFNDFLTLETSSPQKLLIEMILQSIVAINLPKNAFEQIFNKFQHPEILMLKCGQNLINLRGYLNNKLTSLLRKVHVLNLRRSEYTELLNLLDIWCRKPQLVDILPIKDDFVKGFLKIFSIQLYEIHKFNSFFNKSFCILRMLKYSEIHILILAYLRENINKTKAIGSVSMLVYLLETYTQNQIMPLLTPELQKLHNFIKDIESKEFNFKCLNDLYCKTVISNQNFEPNASKRPCLGNECKSSDCKYILNYMVYYSRQLSNATFKFDNVDYVLLNGIKENIQKCLLK